MMGSKQRHFAPLIYVSLEDLVPVDHFYRHLERMLDLSFVREFVQETYAGGGRPSIDPIVFFKLQLVMFFEVYWLLGTSVRKIANFAFSSSLSICLARETRSKEKQGCSSRSS
jgi:hypothetical protein